MNKTEQQRLTNAFTQMDSADLALKEAVDRLAEFGTNVPPVNAEALKMMAEKTNTISKSVEFIRSFVRVSLLQQVVPVETKGSS